MEFGRSGRAPPPSAALPAGSDHRMALA